MARSFGGTRSKNPEEDLLKYVLDNAVDGSPDSVLKCIDEFGWKNWVMCVGDVKGAFVDQAIQQVNPQPCKTVLEIGLYCGYSSTRIASQLPEDGKVYSIEPSEKHRTIAAQVHEKAGVGHKVEILAGTADQVIPGLKESGLKFDMVFIDHDKSVYLSDLKLLEAAGLMREDTVVVADNVVVFELDDYLKHVRSSGKYKRSSLYEAPVEYTKDRPDGVEVSVYAG